MADNTGSTQSMLVYSFKSLLTNHPFEKVTVQMIADDAGVKRPTFYNHFLDKYELFSWILEEELFQPINKLIDADMEKESMKMIFSYFEKNNLFYVRAFQVEGQNSFEDILENRIEKYFSEITVKHGLEFDGNLSGLTREVIEKYYASGLVYVIKKWITEDSDTPYETVFEAYVYLISNSVLDLIANQ